MVDLIFPEEEHIKTRRTFPIWPAGGYLIAGAAVMATAWVLKSPASPPEALLPHAEPAIATAIPDVPDYPGGTVTSSTLETDPRYAIPHMTFTTADEILTVAAWHDEQLPAYGWEPYVPRDGSVEAPIQFMVWKKGDVLLNISYERIAQATQVTLDSIPPAAYLEEDEEEE